MNYSAFGHVIDSDRHLPELPRATASDQARLAITWNASITMPEDLRWSVVWPADPEVSFARAGADRFLRYENAALVRISSAGIEIAFQAELDAGHQRHMLLDQILPLALASSGHTVLHASAVNVGGAAVLFVGESGTGKSTLAAALSTCGAAVLADDGVLLQARDGDSYAVPSYPGLRLWPDAAEVTDPCGFSPMPLPAGRLKRRLVPSAACSISALPIACIYSLATADGARDFSRLSRRDAAIELVRHAFTPDVHDRSAILAHLDRAACWAGRLEMWRLTFRRDLSALASVARAVVAHVRRHHTSGVLQER